MMMWEAPAPTTNGALRPGSVFLQVDLEDPSGLETHQARDQQEMGEQQVQLA